MTRRIVPVIMAGGKGTRLWPLSRSAAPKQFMQFVNDYTLFQSTLLRVSDQTVYEPAVVITNESFHVLVTEQAREMGVALSAIVLEPVPRNTAAAVAAAALVISRLFKEDRTIHVLASDHDINVDDSYHEAHLIARLEAADGKLATFGITPTEPAIGYGYIEVGEALASGAYKVSRFVEKPAFKNALEMLSAGGFYWNSGIFMFSLSTVLVEIAEHAPEVLKAVNLAVSKSVADHDCVLLDTDAFERCPDISFDYAVMEKTSRAVVVPSAFGWSDLGSWDAVWKTGRHDENHNVASAHTTLTDTRNSLIMTQGAHLAVHGLEGIAVIASEDAVYVGRLHDSQNVRKVVSLLAAAPETARLTELHPTTCRPWGDCTTILNGEHFQVRRITVRPGKRLSLQRHRHRCEHWIVIKGTAEVTIANRVQILNENESVCVATGEEHRLANPGNTVTELIEIQTGSYLGDDDIVRASDGVERVE
ncbi:mannose-1-phosphate guanylyltransferase/mannose-6-phosphate isomerase [Sinorhizobium medicae]|uniref:mannose-1-phosphate guanylyltransferase n=2 Tax=Sinorhizobium medicae TaxID=110321 RepID=A6UIV8_SINMW|nr:mannose-1-phosphate guanylyltransferase/mannose-6-phosphate isomerase [Sinorhizobium medicae]ABR63588.1 mannose-1-phosphate guanylyltransferase/mannose-6-phosphate isomerase [Sinorhizobium medicae WSM419]MBO1941861.1 mannose-1-phosphate guanylyltransferase/mannose-6-phosphate isomerase [Sinorhizobium medicae]MDX0434148.1 mannose-1-phosphate guanylyltransferase/mannose-6-phosphate isomerase [Sinorhizobium medicae]MDX0520804.1 mannose-1-phosphate guanylyltransferase/mannose-6-phosphate isomera